MGFGHRVYRAEDPRARVLRRTAKEIGAPRAEVAEALENAALAELKARSPDRVLATNVEFWSAVVLDYADIPPRPVHADVRLRPRRRLVRAHPRAEARGAPDPPDGQVRRPRAPRASRGSRRLSSSRPGRASPISARSSSCAGSATRSPCARRASTRASSTASPARSARRTSSAVRGLLRRRPARRLRRRGDRGHAARGGLHARVRVDAVRARARPGRRAR